MGAAPAPLNHSAHPTRLASSARTGGEPSLDSAQLQKLCRDAELLSRQLTATRLDLMFAGTVGKVGVGAEAGTGPGLRRHQRP